MFEPNDGRKICGVLDTPGLAGEKITQLWIQHGPPARRVSKTHVPYVGVRRFTHGILRTVRYGLFQLNPCLYGFGTQIAVKYPVCELACWSSRKEAIAMH